MDKEKLRDIIVREAQKDNFNGVGRVYVRDLKKGYNTTDEQLTEALNLLPFKHRFWPDENGAILIYFAERKLDIRDYRVKRRRRTLTLKRSS